MTIKEAEEKVCPMMSSMQIVPNIEAGYTTSSYEELAACKCITTKCMFWIEKYVYTGRSTEMRIDGYCKVHEEQPCMK